jgi:release factor glutamine methyltransferase
MMMTPNAVADPPDTIASLLRSAARALGGCSDSPELDAEVLLGHLLGAGRSALWSRGDETLRGGTGRAYRELIDRRAGGVPVAYLTGLREFWSLPLKVTPAVLVPRPETELLVEQALELLTPADGQPADGQPAVLDLGTGSGAIAIAVASERRHARMVGVDISEAAASLARENAEALGLSGIEWRVGSWFSAVPGERFDLILANPPYVAAGDPVLASLRAEPAIALIGGATGLEHLASIIAGATAHLVPGGWLLVEHGADQAREVASLFGRHGFADVHSLNDYAGRPRMMRGRQPVCRSLSPNQEPP